MRYYRCQCGERTAWGSMPPFPCSGCEKCGTTLEEAPGLHRTPEPHNWRPTTVETDEGPKTLTRCSWCSARKPIDAGAAVAEAIRNTKEPLPHVSRSDVMNMHRGGEFVAEVIRSQPIPPSRPVPDGPARMGMHAPSEQAK